MDEGREQGPIANFVLPRGCGDMFRRNSYSDAPVSAKFLNTSHYLTSHLLLATDRASYRQVLCVDGGFDSTGIGLPTLRGKRLNT